MTDVNPAALSRSDTLTTPSSAKGNGATGSSEKKASKVVATAQRVDYEHIYTALKGAVSEHWGEYHQAFCLFMSGGSRPWLQ